MGRYKILTQARNQCYTVDCPILLLNYAITYDREKSQTLVQLKFQNIGIRDIEEAHFEFKCVDADGQILEGIEEYAYSGIHVKSREIFGSNIPVYVPDNRTREVRIKCIRLQLEGNQTWNNTRNEWFKELPQNKVLAETMEKSLYEQLIYEETVFASHTEPIYAPYEKDGIWLCACGAYNVSVNNVCGKCGQEYLRWEEKLNPQRLKAAWESRNMAQKSEIQRKKQEEEKDRQKRKKKCIIWGGVFAGIVLVFLLTTLVFMPMSHYNKASEFMKNGQYGKAESIYESLGGYKDSEDKLIEAQKLRRDKELYVSGEQYYNDKDYYEAYHTWDGIEDKTLFDGLETKIKAAESYMFYEEALELAGRGYIPDALEVLDQFTTDITEVNELKDQLTNAIQEWVVGEWKIIEKVPDDKYRFIECVSIVPLYEDNQIKYICLEGQHLSYMKEQLEKQLEEGIGGLKRFIYRDGVLTQESDGHGWVAKYTKEGDNLRYSDVEYGYDGTVQTVSPAKDLFQKVEVE